MKSALSRERRAVRRFYRRVLRDHRVEGRYLHSRWLKNFGGGASMWGYWSCPRCRGYKSGDGA